MAKEVRDGGSIDTVTSGGSRIDVRRTSLPLFPSDLGKNVPNYLRHSAGSCHDHCKYGRKETPEIKQRRPWIKRTPVVPLVSRNVVLSKSVSLGKKAEVSMLKLPYKPASMLDYPLEICKPEILYEVKTSEVSFKQSASSAKETTASEHSSKSLKPKLLSEKPLVPKPAVNSRSSKAEKLKRHVAIGSGKNNLDKKDAKTANKSDEGGKDDMVTESGKTLSTDAGIKLNARAKPLSSRTPLKLAARVKPQSSPSPHSLKPLENVRPYSSLSQSKTSSVRAKSLSSSTKLWLKPTTVKTSPPSSPPRSLYSKKNNNIRAEILKKRGASKVRPSEAVANRRGSVSPKVKVATSLTKKELDEAENAETKEPFVKNEEVLIHETEFEVENQKDEEDSIHETELEVGNQKNEEDSIHETELEVGNQKHEEDLIHEAEHEVGIQKNGEDPIQQAELDVGTQKNEEDPIHEAELELGNQNNEEDPIHETERVVDIENEDVQIHEAELELGNQKNEEGLIHETELEVGNQEAMKSQDEDVSEKTLYVIKMETGNNIHTDLNAEDEIPDIEPPASLTPPMSPRYAEQETPDIEPLPSSSPVTSPECQSGIMASNRSCDSDLSEDDLSYTESEEEYSSDEDDHLIKGENLMDADKPKLKKSATVTSQDSGKDPVKLKFRRGRVIDITEENLGPRRLKFRRKKGLDEKAAKELVRKSSFKVTEATQDATTTDNSSETVVLRHQDLQDKKDAQGLFNNVIEETATKLAETRKSKVKALVGAFETVISLQDGKSAST